MIKVTCRIGILVFGFFFAASACAEPRGLIDPAAAKALLDGELPVVLLDVRTAAEYNTGFIPGAKLLPFDQITALTATQNAPDPRQPVIIYCRTGRRSAIAAKAFRDLGYSQVFDLGGINQWPYQIIKP